MAYKVNFNGIELSEFCTILDIKKSLLPNRDNFSQVVPIVNGSYYTGYRYNERVIQLEVFITGKTPQELALNASKLSNVINTSAPCKITTSDEPDLYWFAVLDGATEINKSVFSASLSLSFVCNNPYAYSNIWQTSSPNNRGVLNFINTGTADTYPVIDVIFKNKACFFQATNQSGQTVLVGKPKELDKPIVPESDIVVEDTCRSSASFSTLSSALLPSGYETTGAGYGVGFNGEGIIATNYGSGTGWHGASFRRNLDADLSEFEVSIDFVFSSSGENYIVKPEPVPPTVPPTGTDTYLGTFKVVNCGGLWINQEANTNTPLYAMAPNTLIYPTEYSNGWYKHTHQTPYATVTGWSYEGYLQKVSDNGKLKVEEFAETQVGTLEIFGYDRNGTQLFRSWNVDASEWFESTHPHIFFGKDVVLEEDSNTWNPRQETVGEGDNATQQNAVSGAVGRWNDWDGKIVIRREKNSSGQFLWSSTIYKYVNGATVAQLSTQNSMSSSSFPSGNLNYLGFFLGGYGQNKTMSISAITNIKVRRLNMKTDESTTSNISLFDIGDRLQINFDAGVVTLNGQSILDKVDIGSNFFSVPSGESKMICRSDDSSAVILAGIQNKYI